MMASVTFIQVPNQQNSANEKWKQMVLSLSLFVEFVKEINGMSNVTDSSILFDVNKWNLFIPFSLCAWVGDGVFYHLNWFRIDFNIAEQTRWMRWARYDGISISNAAESTTMTTSIYGWERVNEYS